MFVLVLSLVLHPVEPRLDMEAEGVLLHNLEKAESYSRLQAETGSDLRNLYSGLERSTQEAFEGLYPLYQSAHRRAIRPLESGLEFIGRVDRVVDAVNRAGEWELKQKAEDNEKVFNCVELLFSGPTNGGREESEECEQTSLSSLSCASLSELVLGEIKQLEQLADTWTYILNSITSNYLAFPSAGIQASDAIYQLQIQLGELHSIVVGYNQRNQKCEEHLTDANFEIYRSLK